MEYYSLTDKGKVRNTNQDSVNCAYNQSGDFIAILSDGIGGHKAGDVASFEIVTYLAKVFSETSDFNSFDSVEEFIKIHFHQINRIIYQMSLQNIKLNGMGATIVACIITKIGAFWVNVGDSRIYIISNKKIKQISSDHTLINELLSSNLISKEEALIHPKRHHITRAIGIWENINIDYGVIDNNVDYYLLCSDGLHGFVDDDRIERVLKDNSLDTMNKTKKLMDLALNEGGNDNISIILIKNNKELQ